MCTLQFRLSLSVSLLVNIALADVSHIFPQEFGFFSQHQHHHPHQHPFHISPLQPIFVPQPVAPPPPTTLPTLYNAPSTPSNDAGGYPQAVTHSPVAPTRPSTTTSVPLTTTTEFSLPEIVENRSVKQQQHHHYQHNFIPLNNIFSGGGTANQYLPPPISEQRPNYDSPVAGGYSYPRPTIKTTTTSTTTEHPRPIVVVDHQPPFVLPPITDSLPPTNGGGLSYDYNAPVGPAFTLPPAPPQLQRPSTPAPAYLPPAVPVANSATASDGNNAIVVEHLDPNVPPLRVVVQEMRCVQSNGSGYFRTVLKVNNFLGAAPSIEDSNVTVCEPRLARSFLFVDLTEADFGRCGVRTCGKDLCLRVRFPALRGMRTGWDSILTLHCKVQDRVAIKTHALKIGVGNEIQARSLGTYARGGTQNPFRTHVELQRRISSEGAGYTRLLDGHNGNVVQLGEDLLLRAHVIPGDGWNYTKLTDVSLERIAANGEVLNSANLITNLGCLNPSMQSVCSQLPIFEPPLGHRLSFRAVMFQGMRSGDEVVLSMRITGCLEQSDCEINVQECSNVQNNSNLNRRRRREVTDPMAVVRNETEVSEISRIAIRVVMSEDVGEPTVPDKDNGVSSDFVLVPAQRTITLLGSMLFVASLCFVGFFAWWQLKLK